MDRDDDVVLVPVEAAIQPPATLLAAHLDTSDILIDVARIDALR